ncbi:mitochondrial lysine-tRNA synthetase [Vermiconidia calcicola]|uniref:Mitochondrial lysine-tRNA synthetase n=1 Tax=Vermiconidia calcicola TaxID=1690605 RepID=A0ACC3NAS3_9PEZI|nr:mitochondrial lysine-tRNA synthetase [Vermiconidia calcicola]
MSQNLITRRLRPYLFTSYFKRTRPTPNVTCAFCSTKPASQKEAAGREGTNDYERRVAQLEAVSPAAEWYPRLHRNQWERTSSRALRKHCEGLKNGETDERKLRKIAGRIQAVRTAGSKLIFLDVKQGKHTVQAIVQLNKLDRDETAQENTRKAFKSFAKLARKGDWYEIHGHPHRSLSGELSILATSIPTLLSPSLHQIPETLEDAETRARSRHVDMLVNPSAIQTLRVRHLVEKHIRDYLDDEGFTSVHTPILTAGAGGAIARPFETEATELEGQKLNLRIAPELWLKRLVIGGMEKVYEMGPAFRNEGVDATHNPEFHICEFYEAFATLDDLMKRTEDLLCMIATSMGELWDAKRHRISALPEPPAFTYPFKRIEFLPTLQEQLGPNHTLPDLTSDPAAAAESLISIFRAKDLSIPSNPTLPRLLDALSSHYLERLSKTQPVFITHHPASLSPLSKHFTCSKTNQLISARAELFIHGREIANMYEEENSPFSQRQKFLEQLQYRNIDGEGDGHKGVDESYLEALEWGLPPTGGWGCGMDRLVMLFAGRERIGEVLAFGGLRNVVGVSRGRGR